MLKSSTASSSLSTSKNPRFEDEECASDNNFESDSSVDMAELEKEETHKQRPYLGLILGVLSSLLYSLCSVIVKYLDNISPIELVSFKFVGVLIPTLPFLVASKEDVWPEGNRLMIAIRSVVGALSFITQYYAIRHLPLADSSVILFSAPVFVTIFARIFLKETCDLISTACIMVTMIGVLLIARPPFLFHGVVREEYKTETFWGSLAAISSTVLIANTYVVLRILRGLHWSVILFNYSIVTIVMTSFLTMVIGDAYFPCSSREWLMILALGAFSFGAQFLLTLAFKMEQAGPVSIARTSDIVFAFIWQILFFHEVPTVWTIAGALLVTSSVLLTAIRKWMTSLSEASPVKDRMAYRFK